MMLTDARLAELTVLANGIEREIRRYHALATSPREKESALKVLRQAVALRKPMETWIADRACRAPVHSS